MASCPRRGGLSYPSHVPATTDVTGVNGIRTGAVERSKGVNGKGNNGEYMLISMKEGGKRQYMGIFLKLLDQIIFRKVELTKEGTDEKG